MATHLVLSGTIKSISDKGRVRGWEFRDIYLESERNVFRILFWKDDVDIPTSFSVGDKVSIPCELTSQQKLDSQGNTYTQVRIKGWAIRPVFSGEYVADRLRAQHNPDFNGVNQTMGNMPLPKDAIKDIPV